MKTTKKSFIVAVAAVVCFLLFFISCSKPIPAQPSCGQAWIDGTIRRGMTYQEIVQVVGLASEVMRSNGQVEVAFWRKTGYYISRESCQRELDTNDYILYFEYGKLDRIDY